MELDELKKNWEKYDQKLNENLKFNEEIMKKLNLNSSKRELQKPLIYEIGNIIITFFIFLFAIASIMRLPYEIKYIIPAAITGIISILGFTVSVIKVNRFMDINYFQTPVLQLQKQVQSLNKMILRIRKFELVLILPLIAAILPLLFMMIHGIDLYQHIDMFLIEITVILAVSLPATVWINRQLYDKKFKNASDFLAELEAYDKEDS